MDLQLFSALYGLAHRSDGLDALIIFLATDFTLIVLATILFYLYSHHDRKRGAKEVLAVTLAAVLAWGVSGLIKQFFPALRPEMALDGIVPLFAHGTGLDSFPSGHTTILAGFAAGFLRYHRKLAYTLFGIALLVGLARVAAGVHFPIDVLGGLILGGSLGYWLASRFAPHAR